MLRNTLIALAAASALGLGAGAADAKMGGQYGGSGQHSIGHSPSSGKSMTGPGPGAMSVRRMGPPGPAIKTAGPVGTWSKGSNWKSANWQGRHHHRFRNNAFFIGAVGVGFGAGLYGGYYDSCWRLVPTYWGGWQRVWVCDPYYGDYGGYWGY
jgi:hypothetical protein